MKWTLKSFWNVQVESICCVAYIYKQFHLQVSLQTTLCIMTPNLTSIIEHMDETANEKENLHLLGNNRAYLEQMIYNTKGSISIPFREDLALSSFLVDLGVIYAYLTGKSVTLVTHCVYWAYQAEIMVRKGISELVTRFGDRNVEVQVKVPCWTKIKESVHSDLILLHGVYENLGQDRLWAHQDLGHRWDGIIRHSLGCCYE